MEPLHKSEGLLVSQLQKFVENLIVSDRKTSATWNNVRNEIVSKRSSQVWDIGDLCRVFEEYWTTIRGNFNHNYSGNDREVLNILRTIRDMRNRFRHNPAIPIGQFDIIAFCVLCREILINIKCYEDASSINDIMMSVRISHINHDLEKVFAYRIENRNKIFENAKSYYVSDFDTSHLNLIYKEEWIPNKLIDLRIIDSNMRWKDSTSEFSAGIYQPIYKNNLLSSCIRDNMHGIHIYNNLTYRLVSETVIDEVPILEFEENDYFTYVNFNESLAVELSIFTRANARPPSFERNDLPYRGEPKRALNLRDNGNAVGISAITIVSNSSSKKFILHQRGTRTLEAPGTIHVVPAGTFQPHGKGNANHSRDFSLTRSISREFLEELLGITEANEPDPNGNDILDHKDARMFRNLINDGKIHFRYMGMGIDIVTLKPEILVCILISDGNDDLSFRNNFEGHGFMVDWTQYNLLKFSRRGDMLPAGSACLFLAAKHFNEINKLLI